MKTELEQMKDMLDNAKINYTLSDSSLQITVGWENKPYTVALTGETGMVEWPVKEIVPTVILMVEEGYIGFYTTMEFDSRNGKLFKMGAYE